MKKRLHIFTGVVACIILISVLFSCFNRRMWTKTLFSSIEAGDYTAVQNAIDLGADVNGYKYQIYLPTVVLMNPTPLISACKLGNEEMVRLLIANGAEIELPDKITGETPLLTALEGSKQNRFVLASYLIECGADIRGTIEGGSLLEECLFISTDDTDETIKAGQEMFCYLVENGAPIRGFSFRQNALTCAARLGNCFAIGYLLDNGYFDVNDCDDGMNTALITAAKFDCTEAVELLISYGAEQTLLDSFGMSAMDYAVKNENAAMIELLS